MSIYHPSPPPPGGRASSLLPETGGIMKKLLTLFRSRLTLQLRVTLVVPILGISLCIWLAAGL